MSGTEYAKTTIAFVGLSVVRPFPEPQTPNQ